MAGGGGEGEFKVGFGVRGVRGVGGCGVWGVWGVWMGPYGLFMMIHRRLCPTKPHNTPKPNQTGQPSGWPCSGSGASLLSPAGAGFGGGPPRRSGASAKGSPTRCGGRWVGICICVWWYCGVGVWPYIPCPVAGISFPKHDPVLSHRHINIPTVTGVGAPGGAARRHGAAAGAVRCAAAGGPAGVAAVGGGDEGGVGHDRAVSKSAVWVGEAFVYEHMI